MTDAHGIARDQLRSFIERIERLEEEKKSIADDIKDVYGEAKGTGFDTKILREVIKIRKQDKDERAEREALLDTYMMALGMIAQADFFDDEPEQREPVAQKPATLRRSDGGLNILTKHEDIRTAPETAEEISRPAASAVSGGERSVPSPDAGSVKMDDDSTVVPGRSDEQSAHLNAKSGQATNTNSEKATVATQGEATAPTSDERETDREAAAERVRAAANAGGGDVDGNAERATHLVTGEGTACALPSKPKFVLRPHCRNPGVNCGGSGRDHCWPCRSAMQQREDVA